MSETSKFNLVIVDSVILDNNDDDILPVFERLSKTYHILVLIQKINEDKVVETLTRNNVLDFCSVKERIETSSDTMNIGWVDNSEISESKLINYCKVVLFSSKTQRRKIDKNIGIAQDWDDVLNFFVRKGSCSHIS
jgi:hypothetical protein